MNDKHIKERCQTETIRRKLYRRIQWMKNNPRKEKFHGLATDELFPVYAAEHEYLLFRSIHGKSYNVELVKENELPALYFTDKDILDMGFNI